MTVMGAFGCLTYRNIRQTRVLAQQQADRQLIRMTLFQVILVFICLIPYSINIAYNLITDTVIEDANQLLKESFAYRNLFLLCGVFNYSLLENFNTFCF